MTPLGRRLSTGTGVLLRGAAASGLTGSIIAWLSLSETMSGFSLILAVLGCCGCSLVGLLSLERWFRRFGPA